MYQLFIQTALARTFFKVGVFLLFLAPASGFASPQEITCLAKNIYYEARDQSAEGQYAVAMVTLNRVESKKYPNTICEVVEQPAQFSWFWDGLSDSPKEKQAWKDSLWLASLIFIYKNEIYDSTNGALHYHNDKVSPYWAPKLERVKTIGNHTFYK